MVMLVEHSEPVQRSAQSTGKAKTGVLMVLAYVNT